MQDLVEAFAQAVRASTLPSDVKAEAETATVQAQVNSPRPTVAGRAVAMTSLEGSVFRHR